MKLELMRSVATRETFFPMALSLFLHTALILLFFSGMAFQNSVPPRPMPAEEVDMIEAVAVDDQQVMAEVERMRAAEAQKRNAEAQRLEEVRRAEQQLVDKRRQAQEQAEALQRQTEADLRKKQQEIEKAQAAERAREQKRQQEVEKAQQVEQARLTALKAEQAREQAELMRIKAARESEEKARQEAVRKREAEEKARQEAVRKREAEEKASQEAALKRAADEELRQAAARESAALEAGARQARAASALESVRPLIAARIKERFNNLGFARNLQAELRITVSPTGVVEQVIVERSSGDRAFDTAARNATLAASPLPIPADPELYEHLREFYLDFSPR